MSAVDVVLPSPTNGLQKVLSTRQKSRNALNTGQPDTLRSGVVSISHAAWRVPSSGNKKEKAMKNGICPMCQSTEVYLTDDDDNLGAHGKLLFYGWGQPDQEMAAYHSELYVCLNCGYMALFAVPTEFKGKHQEITFLQNAKGWKKAA
jgi:hypothetical protein